MARTRKEIINQTNEMARTFYKLMGYVEDRKDFNFYESQHPTEKMLWEFACIAQLELTDTDPNELLNDAEEDD